MASGSVFLFFTKSYLKTFICLLVLSQEMYRNELIYKFELSSYSNGFHNSEIRTFPIGKFSIEFWRKRNIKYTEHQ